MRLFILLSILLLGSTSVHANSNLYEVETGETLPEIAASHGTTKEELIRANGLKTEQLLAGQKLRVPILHEVQGGDTLESLASSYYSSEQLIQEKNRLTDDRIFPGQMLHIQPRSYFVQGTHILMTIEEFREWLTNHQFKRQIHLIQQHHTWVPSYKRFNGSNHITLLQGMENYHIQQMHWKTIAQNITTFPDGMIAVSRDFNVAPEGSIGAIANEGGIAIEHVGNFDLGGDNMTAEQKETIIEVNALLCLKFGLTPSIDTITYHHWWNYQTGERVLDNSKPYEVKPCPGTNFFGGNTTTAARENFYPLIVAKMQELSK